MQGIYIKDYMCTYHVLYICTNAKLCLLGITACPQFYFSVTILPRIVRRLLWNVTQMQQYKERPILLQTSICGQCRQWMTTSKSSETSTHYLNGANRFDVLSKGPSSILLLDHAPSIINFAMQDFSSMKKQSKYV